MHAHIKSQLSDVTAGLEYREWRGLRFVVIWLINKYAVHSKNVIHGDLTGVRSYWPVCLGFKTQLCPQSNILIDHDGTARLIDFGLSTIKPDFDVTSFDSSTIGGAVRWLAPELLPSTGKTRVLSRPSDIYSLGSVILQVSLALHKQGHTLTRISLGTFRESSLSRFTNRRSRFTT